jgi:hypothetical protein
MWFWQRSLALRQSGLLLCFEAGLLLLDMLLARVTSFAASLWLFWGIVVCLLACLLACFWQELLHIMVMSIHFGRETSGLIGIRYPCGYFVVFLFGCFALKPAGFC